MNNLLTAHKILNDTFIYIQYFLNIMNALQCFKIIILVE
jgi:hypothetical protein